MLDQNQTKELENRGQEVSEDMAALLISTFPAQFIRAILENVSQKVSTHFAEKEKEAEKAFDSAKKDASVFTDPKPYSGGRN